MDTKQTTLAWEPYLYPRPLAAHQLRNVAAELARGRVPAHLVAALHSIAADLEAIS